ncbi:MAG: hypothetical protein M3011_11990 [Actinomycetota bacterium]|nr:hypothetical protein [Actinomycetota bacterium]
MTGAVALVELGPDDIDRIMELETAVFDVSIRADRSTVLHRFSLGHGMSGAEDATGRLVGAIGFSPANLGGPDFERLPATFKEYSTQAVPGDAGTLCIYTLGVAPTARGISSPRPLINAAFEYGRRAGLRDVVADGPLPSLAGSDQVRPRSGVRSMIDRYLETGELPGQKAFLQDPVLALYSRLTGCRFVKLLPEFLPEDTASAGWRVLLHRDL